MNAEAANDVDPKYYLNPSLHRYFTSQCGRRVGRRCVGMYSICGCEVKFVYKSGVVRLWEVVRLNLVVRCRFPAPRNLITRNSSGDEIANVNFLYDDIVHALKMQ